MAGEMSNRRGETLAQRTANTAAAAVRRPPVGAIPPTPEPVPQPSVRHCWVTGPHARLPGLLLGWEQRVDGWHGRVVHPVEDPDGWVVVEEWLPAGLLEPGSSEAGSISS